MRITTEHKSVRVRSAARGDAAAWVGSFEPGSRLFGFTKSQFSVNNVLDVLVRDVLGRCDRIDIANWTIGPKEVAALIALRAEGLAGQIRILLDRAFLVTRPDRCMKLEAALGKQFCRLTNNHSKVTAIYSGTRAIAIHTSGNLNTATRTEHICVEESPEVCDCISGYLDEVFAAMPEGLMWPLGGGR